MDGQPEGLAALPHWPYLAAAAVLTDFAADKLQPLGGGKPDLAAVGAMLIEHGEAIKCGPATGRWSLCNTSRRAALAELSRQGKLRDALAVTSERPDNPTQREFDALAAGKAPKVKGKSLTELLGLEGAIDLLGPVIDTAAETRAELSAQIQRLRLLEPLQRLVTDGFAGRKKELERLRAYVDELPSATFREWLSRRAASVLDVFRHRKPLVIWGPGGVGKSTLIAKFLLEHAGPDQTKPTPFVYLDFDRGQLDPQRPDTLLNEALRQIKVQFPEFAAAASTLATDSRTRIASEDSADIARSAHFDLSTQLRKDFIEFLKRISSLRESNVLLFLDTFEVVQRRGSTPVFTVLQLAAQLLTDMPRLRLVMAGRADLRAIDFPFTDKSPPWKPLPLEGFDCEAGRVYLEARLNQVGATRVPQSALDRIVSLVRGNPLSLRLAAQVFAKQGLKALEGAVDQASFDVAFAHERVQGMLHSRIVNNLDGPVQKIADPGLIVRRITPEVIAEVLAEPCGLELKPGDANALFERLKNEVALVEPIGGQTLRHRPDVRLLMLPLLRAKLGNKARRIDEAAVAFWKERNDPEARAEEIYHLLWLDTDSAALESSWEQGPVPKLALEEALDEFEALDGSPAVRIWLCSKLNREIPTALEERADLIEWERHTELRARSLLSSGNLEEALRALRSRAERTPASALWSLELETLKLLARDVEALALVDRAWEAAESANVPAHVVALLLQRASLLERTDRLQEALECTAQADGLARSLASDVLQFEADLARARLSRKLERPETADLQRRLASMVSTPTVADAIARRPALLGEATAELGDLRPELFILAAEKLGVEQSDRRVEVSALISLGVAYAQRGESAKAIEVLERAASIAGQLGDQEKRATALLHLGSAHVGVGEPSRAISLYNESLEIAKSLSNSEIHLRALGSLGTAYASMAQFDAASRLYEESLALARAIGDRAGEGNALGNLANACIAMRQSGRAIELLELNLAIERDLGNIRGERQTLGSLGTAYWNQGDLTRATALYEQSLAMARDLGDERGECILLMNLGSLYSEQGDASGALELLRRALEISRWLADPAAEAKALGNLGIVYRKLNDLERARESYWRQLSVAQRLADPLQEGTARYNLALTLDASGDRAAAMSEMQQAFELLRKVGSPIAAEAETWLRGGSSFEHVSFGTETKHDDAGTLIVTRDSTRVSVDQLIKQTIKVEK